MKVTPKHHPLLRKHLRDGKLPVRAFHVKHPELLERLKDEFKRQQPDSTEAQIQARSLFRYSALYVDHSVSKRWWFWALVLAMLLLLGYAAHGQTTPNINVDRVGKAPVTLGQKAMAGSIPVVLASDQSNLPTDPQGPDAQGASQTGKPVQNGGRYYTDGTVRTFAAGANGEQIMQLPTQPFLNVTDFSDVTAGTPVNGDLIWATGGKWARFIGNTGDLIYGSGGAFARLTGALQAGGGGLLNEAQASLAAPSAPALTVSNTGGTITNTSAVTLYVKIALSNSACPEASCLTAASAESSIVVNAANGCLAASTTCSVSVTKPTFTGNANAWNTYFSTTSGQETMYTPCQVQGASNCVITTASNPNSPFPNPLPPFFGNASDGTKVAGAWKGMNGSGRPLGENSATRFTFPGPSPWFDVTDPVYGAKCDNVTDDTAAFQAALNAAQAAGGGTVRVPVINADSNGNFVQGRCLIAGQLKMQNFKGVTLMGLDYKADANIPRAWLRFSGTTSPFIDMCSSLETNLKGLFLQYDNAAATGTFVSLRHCSGGSDSQFDVIEGNFIGDLGAGTLTNLGLLIDLDGADNTRIRDNELHNAAVAIRGADPSGSAYSINNQIERNSFSGSFPNGDIVTAMIQNAHQSWLISGNDFEMGSAAGSPAVLAWTGSIVNQGINFFNNFVGDSTAAYAGTYITLPNNGRGFNMEGNLVQAGTSQLATAIAFPTTFTGFNSKGNSFFQLLTAFALGTTNTVDIGPDDIAATVTNHFTGTPSGGRTVTGAGATRFYNTMQEPTSAGAAPTANGAVAFDSTALQYVGGVNAVKQPFAMQGVVKGGVLNLIVTGSNFVTAANTNLQTITGLSFTFPASLAMNATVDCDLTYSQQTAAVADAFGFQDATVAPTNLEASGFVQTAATTWVDSTLAASSTTTATNIVAMTPSAITTIWHAKLHIGVEQPSNASTSLFSVMVKTGTAADTVTVFRGSGCLVHFQ